MSSDNDHARNLYQGPLAGGRPTKSSDGFASHVTAEEQAALNVLYDGAGADHPTAPEPGELYGLVDLKATFDRHGPDLFSALGTTPAEQDTIQRSFVQIHRRTGLPEATVSLLAKHYLAAQLVDARPVADPDADEHARTVQRAEWDAKSRDMLLARYGAERVQDMLERTRRFVRQHPALSEILAVGDMGSKPEIVEAITPGSEVIVIS